MIYFVQAGLSKGPIKIGYVESLSMMSQRLTALQVGNSEVLSLVTTLPGGMDRERELHAQFAEGRLRGEWFRWDTPGLQEVIQQGADDEALVLMEGLRYCTWCKRRLVHPPRTRVCGEECEREKKRDQSRRWKAAR